MYRLKYYLKISLRSMQRDGKQTLTNVVSLSIAIVTSFLIFGYNFYEESYDTFHENSVYRLQNNIISAETGEVQTRRATTFYGVEGLVEQEIPEVKRSTHVFRDNGVIEYQQVKTRSEEVAITNSKFFKMFTYPLVSGNVDDLDQSGSVFLSESTAEKVFGDTDPMGQRISFFARNMATELSLEVRGVFKDFPSNSYFSSGVIISKQEFINHHTPHIASHPSFTIEQIAWRWVNFYTFLELQENADPQIVGDKVTAFYKKYRESFDQQSGRIQVPKIEHISEIHLNPNVDSELTPASDGFTIKIFYLVGLLILLIAWINGMNIASANAVNKAKEVGVRKVLGAFKKQIFYQLMAQSALSNIIALVFGMGVLTLIVPFYEDFIGKEVFSVVAAHKIKWLIAVLIVIIGGFLFGIYPALMISSFKPQNVLKTSFKYTVKGKRLQRSLMIFQFLIVCILISMSLTVYNQIDYMLNKEKGFSSSGKIVVQMPAFAFRGDTYDVKVRTFRDVLTSKSNISSISGSSTVPGQFNPWRVSTGIAGQDDSESVFMSRLSVSGAFVGTYDMAIVDGRDFDGDLVSDYGSKAIVNEAGMKSLGFSSPEEIIGQRVNVFGEGDRNIIGVVRDFHQEGLHNPIPPMIIHMDSIHTATMITVNAENLGQGIAEVENTFQDIFPSHSFEYSLLDDSLQAQYESDRKFQAIFTFFTGLSILLAISGLHSLSTFFANNRRKEISIRKVLGASTRGLTFLLLNEYWKLVIIASVISLPASYFAISKWLEGYSFHINLNPGLFVFPIIMVGMLVLLTVLRRTVALSASNPVNNLKSE